jgi:hypothetical protein
MSEPSRPLRRGKEHPALSRPARPCQARRDSADEYPDRDPTCTEAYASLCRTGEALPGELGPRIRLTAGIPDTAATALSSPANVGPWAAGTGHDAHSRPWA